MQFESCFIFSLFKGFVFIVLSKKTTQGRTPAPTGFVKNPGVGPGRRGAARTGMLPKPAVVFFVPKTLAAVAKGSGAPWTLSFTH